MNSSQRKTIDLDKLDPAARRRVERAIKARTEMFSRKFAPSDVRAWERAAERTGESMRAWVERHLNAAAART